jgi:hypothetical protein
MALAIEKKGPPHSPQPNNSGRLLIENGQIPAYAKLELAGPGTSITVIWCHRQVNLLNFNRGFDETSSLKPSSGASDSGLL